MLHCEEGARNTSPLQLDVDNSHEHDCGGIYHHCGEECGGLGAVFVGPFRALPRRHVPPAPAPACAPGPAPARSAPRPSTTTVAHRVVEHRPQRVQPVPPRSGSD